MADAGPKNSLDELQARSLKILREEIAERMRAGKSTMDISLTEIMRRILESDPDLVRDVVGTSGSEGASGGSGKKISSDHKKIKEPKGDKIMTRGTETRFFGEGIQVVTEEPEKVQAALDKLFGVKVDAQFNRVQPFSSFRAAYTAISGDEEVRGVPSEEGLRFGERFMNYMRMPAAFNSSTFTYALGNSMHRRLIQDYKAVDYGEEALISYKRNAQDFKSMESVRIGYFSDLPDMNPETADYDEVSLLTDEEISYVLNQKGIIMSITRKMILNDDLRTVQQMVSRLGRAAKRTFARRGWNIIQNNGTYKGDSKNLFHVDHGNLGAVALTADSTGVTTLKNRVAAMFGQLEKDSSEKLALTPKWLWGPIDIQATMRILNMPWISTNTPNPYGGLFGANHERIITQRLATDPNDWGLIGDSNEVELLEVAFLNGKEEPELFLANNPLVGQMFVADKIQYKERHEYEWEIVDYRGFDKSVC